MGFWSFNPTQKDDTLGFLENMEHRCWKLTLFNGLTGWWNWSQGLSGTIISNIRMCWCLYWYGNNPTDHHNSSTERPVFVYVCEVRSREHKSNWCSVVLIRWIMFVLSCNQQNINQNVCLISHNHVLCLLINNTLLCVRLSETNEKYLRGLKGS